MAHLRTLCALAEGAVAGSVLIALNEADEGLRVRFALDDWQRLNLGEGQGIPVRLRGKGDVWLFITSVTEQPPVVWVMPARRIRTPGRREPSASQDKK